MIWREGESVFAGVDPQHDDVMSFSRCRMLDCITSSFLVRLCPSATFLFLFCACLGDILHASVSSNIHFL